ncbi:MAG: SlyX family protein [Spongiibacteraceae bacterium]
MTDTVAELQMQLIELQTQIAFQEDTLSALDTVVTAQQRQIDQLTLWCERLMRQLDQVATGAAEPAEPELPPHY